MFETQLDILKLIMKSKTGQKGLSRFHGSSLGNLVEGASLTGPFEIKYEKLCNTLIYEVFC